LIDGQKITFPMKLGYIFGQRAAYPKVQQTRKSGCDLHEGYYTEEFGAEAMNNVWRGSKRQNQNESLSKIIQSRIGEKPSTYAVSLT